MSKEEVSILAEEQNDLETIYESIDPKKEKALLRKLDGRLSVLFSLIFFLSYLDRSNLGNAKVAGLMEDLNLTESQFSLVSSILYATYTTIQIPGVLVLKKCKANWFFGISVIICGLITLFTVFVDSFAGLVAVRLLLGLFEGSLFTGMSSYVSNCFFQHEIGKRISYFFVSAAISSAFGGLIATGITTIKTGPLESWRYLFLIEGLLTLVIGVIVWIFLPADPIDILNEDEKVIYRLRDEKRRLIMGEEKFDVTYIKRAFSSYRSYISMFIQFFQDIALYGFTTFLPSILRLGLGYNPLQAQYLTIPVYVLAGGTYLAVARYSDKYRIRSPFMIVCNICGLIGYIVIVAQGNNAVKYFGCYMIALMLLSCVGLNESWIAANTGPATKRAVAIGINQSFGNTAGIVAPQVYRQSPYVLGHWFTIGCIICSTILIIIQSYMYNRENKIRESLMDQLESDEKEMDKGDTSVRFRYII